MVDETGLKDYFKKIQRITNFEAVFSFLDFRLIKKQRINDILCCIYAILPESYKKMLKTSKEAKRYKSTLYYDILTKMLKKEFFLDSQLCLVRCSEINQIINSINSTIEKDIANIEKNYNQ